MQLWQAAAARNQLTMLSFETLQSLVAHCTTPGRSNLYRDLYGMKAGDPPLRIQSWDEWHALPFLRKELLSSIPVRERIFIPISGLDHLRVSSGTSGSAPLFCPRTHERGMEYRLKYHDYKKPLLAFTVPMMTHWHESFLKEHNRDGRVIVFDPRYPAASIRLARIAGVDAISVFSHQVPSIGEHMKREGMHQNIRSVEITGERCSRAQLEYIHATFPNASIYETYGASEMDNPDLGIPCLPLDSEHPEPAYHPIATHYLEIIDTDTGNALDTDEGNEGDLLVTAYPGEPSAFPLIRLRIGDTIRVKEARCAVHDSWSYTVVGRTDADFVKVPGGLLRADEIERVLRLFPQLVTDTFILRVREVSTPHGPAPAPTLEVELRQELDVDAFARKIESVLRINPEVTWAEGVAEGRLLPITCTRYICTENAAKHRRIVRH